MSKRNRETVLSNRQAKKKSRGRVIKDKWQDERRVAPFKAKNFPQKQALQAFDTKQLVVLSGTAGTGKTEVMTWLASKLFLEGKVDNIIITRPHTALGTDYGAVTGNDTEKLIPFCYSMLMKLKKYLGYGVLKNSLRMDYGDSLFTEASGIQIIPVEKIQGLSFNSNTIVLADEVQNMTVAQMKALVTRCEEGAQLICAGDATQTALRGENGLERLEEILSNYPHKDSEVIKFHPEDNCRSGVAGHLATLFEKQGAW